MGNTKSNKKKINKQLNLLVKNRETLHKITKLIKINMNLYVIFLIKIWMKQKLKLFHKYEHKNSFKFFW